MDLSIIIVSYNTKSLLLQTLQSVYQHLQDVSAEVFVVDNASSDGSADAAETLFSSARVIRNQENRGFAAANNVAIALASGRYVLLLNSDTVVEKDTFSTMIAFMDCHPGVGASGCKVVKTDGTLDLACRRSFPTPMNSLYQALKLDKMFPQSPRFASYNLTYLDENQSYPVDCLVGAFMMVRRDVIEQVGGLDERFFMYGEDIDWCFRIKQAGWDVWYHPQTSILHFKGASSRKKKVRMIYEFHRAMWLYYDKHLRKSSFFLVNWAVFAGIAARYGMVMAANLFKKRGAQIDDSIVSGSHQSNSHLA